MAEVSSQHIQELRDQYEDLRTSLDVDGLDSELKELEGKLAQPGFWDNQETAQEVVARLKSVKKDTDAFSGVGAKLDDLEVLLELVDEGEGGEAELAAELKAAEKALSQLQLRSYFTGPHDKHAAYVSIQTGAGGIDACDWAQMMLRMLTRYCERLGFDVELLESTPDDTAGIKNATLHVKGRGAFGWLKSERGTHRLVRISPFDAQARRQTSFVAVDITPQFDDTIDVEIKDSDLRIDTFSAGGPGGQHVNKTQSAIRITHKPSGIVVQCQNERHQHANKRTAMQMLKNRLYQLELEKREAEAAAGYATKSNMGFGAADRIRTYTMQPFTLVKDTRTGQEATDVNAVLDGGIDDFVEAYLRWAAGGAKKG